MDENGRLCCYGDVPMECLANANSTWRLACRCAISDGVSRRSLYVALIVGTVLNLINQGDAILAGGPINWAKVILTFAVPYLVSTYGAVSCRLTRRQG